MNRNLTKYLLILIGACLLGTSESYAQEATPTETSQPVMIFTEMAHAPNSLVFTVNSDGTSTLAITLSKNDPKQIIWQETNTIMPEQLDQVKALRKPLSAIMNESWRGDYSFEFSTDDGKTKTVELFSGYQHVDPNMDKTLQKIVQTLLDIRKPFEPLVVFGWSGGFVGRSTQLAIKADGTATFEDKVRKAVAKDKVSQADLEKLHQLLQDRAFTAYAPSTPSSCADCWVYAIAATTDQGIKVVEVDEVSLESAPQSIKTLVTLLKNLSTQEASRLDTVTPTPTISPTLACCTNTVKPGDSNRYIGVLGSKDVLVGAAKLLQLRPNEAPAECVALVFHGPLSYDVTLLDGFWLQEKSDSTPEELGALTQLAIDTVTESCGKGHVQILRIP